MQEGKGENSTRLGDSPPWWMGAELRYNTSYYCSAGVPITTNGTRRLLTAGHCTGSTFTNNGNVVGTTYTTTYPGNAHMYGDWKLIQGSTYGTRVFSGIMSSNDSLPISGANYGGRPEGLQMCTSGRTTAQICRYFAAGSYATHTVNGVTSNYQQRMYHDGNLDGYADRSGFDLGDSGGPCYYSDGSGGVVVNGIVKGFTKPSTGAIEYYCTQLTGVRYWDAGSYVG
jgi:hypothetical protein